MVQNQAVGYLLDLMHDQNDAIRRVCNRYARQGSAPGRKKRRSGVFFEGGERKGALCGGPCGSLSSSPSPPALLASRRPLLPARWTLLPSVTRNGRTRFDTSSLSFTMPSGCKRCWTADSRCVARAGRVAAWSEARRNDIPLISVSIAQPREHLDEEYYDGDDLYGDVQEGYIDGGRYDDGKGGIVSGHRSLLCQALSHRGHSVRGL